MLLVLLNVLDFSAKQITINLQNKNVNVYKIALYTPLCTNMLDRFLESLILIENSGSKVIIVSRNEIWMTTLLISFNILHKACNRQPIKQVKHMQTIHTIQTNLQGLVHDFEELNCR